MFVAFNITNYMLLGYMPSYLDEVLGISDKVSTPVTAIVLIIMIPLALSFGKFADKFGNKKVITFALIIGIALSIIAFALLNVGTIITLFIGLLLIGLVLSVYEGTMPELYQHYSILMLDIVRLHGHSIFLFQYLGYDTFSRFLVSSYYR